MIREKACSTCKSVKEISCFNKQPNAPDGYAYVCKVCKKDNVKKKTDTLKGLIQFILYSSKTSAKKRGYAWDLTTDYITDLYHKQDGRCAVTGEVLSLERKHRGRTVISIDRIDNNVGYVPGNIQLVTFQTNIAKSNYSMDELKEFCKKVIQHAA